MTARIIDADSLRPQTGGAPMFEGSRQGGVETSFFVSGAAPGQGAALHRHPYDEVFVLLEGEARFWVDGEQVDGHAGQIVVVPAGAAHKFVNTGTEPLRSVNIHPRNRMVTEWLDDR